MGEDIINRAGEFRRTSAGQLARNSPAWNAYDSLMQTLGQMSASGDKSVRAWLEDPILRRELLGHVWKRMTWLTQNLNNLGNVDDSLGEYISRYTNVLMAQQNPDLYQYWNAYPDVPPPQGRLG